MKNLIVVIILFFSLVLTSCQNEPKEEPTDMDKKLANFVETDVNYDETLLDENQKIVLQKLYEAAKVMDDIFLNQVYAQNEEVEMMLEKSSSDLDKQKLEYFKIMFGPFDRLDHNKPFVEGHSKPKGANYYPADLTKEEFENWLKEHPEDEAVFTSEFTVIERDGDKLVAVPYSQRYEAELIRASDLLKEAAKFADNPTLKKYLQTRAYAFLSNDYYESDMAWMDLKDHTIEVIIGPYEVYEDEMFNYKAAFESFLTIVDPEESKKVKIFANYLDEMESNLPIPDEHKNFDRGSESPIVVVQEVFSAGDTKAGVQTLAFNLPNDERVRKAKGSKKVMLKNIHEAKFEKLMKPIAEIVMDESQLSNVTFEGFFNHTLMHEMSHGVGPGFISKNGAKTEVKKELKETYSTMEECKADILGMWNNLLMIEKGIYPAEFENEMWHTFLAGVFRSIRFGISEAHGGGNAIIYNYMLQNGAYEYNETTQKVKVNHEKAEEVLKKLATEVLMIQALGDYDAAKKMITDYAVYSPSMRTLVDKLADLPVDIKPNFEIEK
ncbi:MAG: peptidase [Melioribacteraceae bacterium]|nr:peptidase [Melioribacteraceae bacterium]